MRTLSLVAAGTLCAVGCGPDTSKLEAAAQALLDSADDCLVTVRDKRTKYDQTPSCAALKALSGTYIHYQVEGHMLNDTPARIELLFTKAQRSAWIALGLSETDGRIMSIW